MAIVNLVPSVLPMNGVCLDPPIPVRVMRKKGEAEPGKNYFLRYVLPEGQCLIFKDISCLEMVRTNPLKMGELVEMVTELAPEPTEAKK